MGTLGRYLHAIVVVHRAGLSLGHCGLAIAFAHMVTCREARLQATRPMPLGQFDPGQFWVLCRGWFLPEPRALSVGSGYS